MLVRVPGRVTGQHGVLAIALVFGLLGRHVVRGLLLVGGLVVVAVGYTDGLTGLKITTIIL